VFWAKACKPVSRLKTVRNSGYFILVRLLIFNCFQSLQLVISKAVRELRTIRYIHGCHGVIVAMQMLQVRTIYYIQNCQGIIIAYTLLKNLPKRQQQVIEKLKTV